MNFELDEAQPAIAASAAEALRVAGAALGQLLIDVVGRHADPADEAAADLMTWLDVRHKRNLVLTFGGVNEVQRELIAMAGLRLPRVPR